MVNRLTLFKALTVGLLMGGNWAGGAEGRLASPAAVAERIKTIRADNVAWRGIAWKTCLLEGLAEARRTGRPLMIWCYIDRPVGDTRC